MQYPVKAIISDLEDDKGSDLVFYLMTTPVYEAIGFVAFGLNVAGNWLLTSKSITGWQVRILSNIAQLAYALLILSPYLIVNSIVFLWINVCGLVRWKQDAKQSV